MDEPPGAGVDESGPQQELTGNMAVTRGHTTLLLGVLLLLLPVPCLSPHPAQGQVLNRLRRAAERAVDAALSLPMLEGELIDYPRRCGFPADAYRLGDTVYR